MEAIVGALVLACLWLVASVVRLQRQMVRAGDEIIDLKKRLGRRGREPEPMRIAEAQAPERQINEPRPSAPPAGDDASGGLDEEWFRRAP